MTSTVNHVEPVPRNVHAKLEAHRGPVNVARYSKGAGRYILTGGQDRTVRLWNAATGSEVKTFAAHGYEVLSVSVSHDNAQFASCGGDRSVFLWDVATASTTRRIPGHMGKIHAVEFNEDASVLASGSFDSTVRLWDLKAQTRQPIQVLEEARDAVQTLHVGSTYIITGSLDGHVRTYDLRKGELRSDYIGQPVTSVVPTADSQTLLVTTLDSHIRLMDATTGKLLNDFTGHKNTDYHCRACFGHGEASVICGDENGAVWAWDLLDAKPLPPSPPMKVHQKVITWTEHNPVEKGEMVTASADGTVKIWRIPE
ncbi:Mitogen-activated protein kinase organizer 1 [Mycena chlorophos]|uniref:Mitogen-activated protein kinase organizer 1 n=1 Tax=Mycena chlorophos TaxID=658473 RepID=A0A8H6SW12_MYCCL|nr:Mitogen-activated protein kinase organizer 1 [Mycena chlorophos]